MQQPPSVLIRADHIDSPTHPDANAMLVIDGVVRWLGVAGTEPVPAGHTIDVRTSGVPTVVMPAFVDAHVHTTATGLMLTGLDLTMYRSGRELLVAVADYAHVSDGVVLGHGFDDTEWSDLADVTPEALDIATAGRGAYLSRIDVHSALVSRRLRAEIPQLTALTGFHPTAPLTQDAHHAARTLALESVTASARRAAQRAARQAAARHGIAALHECGGPLIAGADDFLELLALAATEPGPEVIGWWGERDVKAARELGAYGAGGDIFVDGSLGSHTACVSEPYVDIAGTGAAYLSVDEIAEHVVACVHAGMPTAFHAIGDCALTTLLEGYAKAATVVPTAAIRAGRHRIEHAHMLTPAHIRAVVEFGLTTSLQPSFDALWGGADGMYARRLGADRAATLMPFGVLAGTGVAMAFGSDSPAGPMGPWRAVRAAVRPRQPGHAITARAAFAAHTRGGWRSVGRDDVGVLTPGRAATFAVYRPSPQWEHPTTDPSEFLTNVVNGVDPVWVATAMAGVFVEVSGDVDVEAGATR